MTLTALTFAVALVAQDTDQLNLEAAVRRALGQYPTVAAARAARDRATADSREAGSQLRPRLSLDGSITQYQLPAIVFPLHGFPTPTAPPPGGNPVFERTLLQGSASLNWTLFDFGARSGRARAARALVSAADAALGSAEQSLVARTANAWLRVLTSRQTLAAQDQRITALAAEAGRTRSLLAEGKIARVALLRAEAALARARADRSATLGQKDVAEHDLAQLTAEPWENIVRSTLPSVALRDTSALTDAARPALVERARAANLDLLEVRRRLGAAQAGLTASRATRLPELRASAGVVDRGSTGSDFRAEWQAGLGISYGLYTGGQRRAAIDRAAADAQGAAEQLRLAEMNVTQSVDRAIAAVTEARARVVALQSAVDQTVAVADIERTSLEVGSGTQTDYLDALSLALQSRSQLIEARHAEIAARIELARVTGELSPDWIANHLESNR